MNGGRLYVSLSRYVTIKLSRLFLYFIFVVVNKNKKKKEGNVCETINSEKIKD